MFKRKIPQIQKEFCRGCSLSSKCKKIKKFRLTVSDLEHNFDGPRPSFTICEDSSIIECMDSFMKLNERFGDISCQTLVRIRCLRNDLDEVSFKILRNKI